MALLSFKKNRGVFFIFFASAALATFGVLVLLFNIIGKKQEAKRYPFKVVEIAGDEIDPSVWGKNFPHQYDSFVRTETDYGETEYGGSTPYSKLERYPDMKRLWAGYAFSVDHNEDRGHYYTSIDQANTLRTKKVSQPGACVNCHAAEMPSLVREMALAGCTGVFVGFESLNAANLTDAGKRTPPPEVYAERVRLLQEHGIQVNGSFVLGFDHDTVESFAQLVDWIEETRLECATFQILTPYPGTPLFARLESEGRILHRDWDRYDTAHAVFLPRNMTPEELEEGYSECYRRVFSHASIWHRRPHDHAAIPGYLAMSYLYKRCNWLWSFLIRHQLVAVAWRPLVRAARRRHLRFRCKLARSPAFQSIRLAEDSQ